MIPIPPEIQTTIASAVSWLWGEYGAKAVEKATGKVRDEAKWRWSIDKYYTSLYEKVGFVRILGRMEAEPLENVFTHVNVMEKLLAEQRYDIARLKAEFAPRDFSWHERVKRISGEEAVAEYPKLYILGKPGAGKTTFLKHTALRAIKHEIKKIPIFVTLKELSDSGQEILEFIIHQFQVHRFPDPEEFVVDLLKDGNGIVLFDGLDEVNLADDKRATLISQLNDFVYQYGDCPILLTCRVAATDYSFTQFDYVEMADFDEGQMGHYIDRWFVGNETKRMGCRKALLEDEQNKAVRELAQVPLLLALLCLVYEERNEIPPNRDEIYEEATRALLSKWDASRNISRDTVYKELSLKRKQKMLA
ncbi:MAG: NACHT domain-containing protein [Ardenticatenaceae bacterium]|nr:NACHT domain-containing protein [Ardenticatenaceae bacterium]MCB9446453.1 NACHT domain-containing protein [Ardenticatenaceae bacterium]